MLLLIVSAVKSERVTMALTVALPPESVVENVRLVAPETGTPLTRHWYRYDSVSRGTWAFHAVTWVAETLLGPPTIFV
jgi:hypothetical protein